MENKVKITPLVTGYFRLPRAPFFGVAETVVKKKFRDSFTIDEHDRVLLAIRSLLVRTPDGIFLIEPGLGTKPHEYADKYCAPERKSWKDIFRNTGVALKDITGVLSSHLHWDHSGGNTKLQGGKLLATFKNATYFIHQLELQNAQDKESQRLPQSYDLRDIPPNSQIKTVPGILTEVAPRIWLELTGGHTPGHCMIHIEGDDQRHVFIGDIAPTMPHLTTKGGYEMAFDDDARMVFARKRSLIRRAKQENWRLWFVHDPNTQFVDGKDLE